MNTAGMIEVEEIRQLLSHLHGEITVLDDNVQSVRSILRKLSTRAAQKNPAESRAISRFFAASSQGQKHVETLEQLWEKIAREYERLIGVDPDRTTIQPPTQTSPSQNPTSPISNPLSRLLHEYCSPTQTLSTVA